MGLGQLYGHRRPLNNIIPPCEGKDSGKVTNKLRGYRVTLYSKKSKNKKGWGLCLTPKISGVGIKRLL